eukprot:Protomagalhaensia_sp_Gyna_25__1218@NODE_1604_length_1696_cov_7_561859_g1310_i0_p1_GENE_NODE_1604_length_1696_cov_7_561859_g1310_i0NODE_1604_length_1696_cov_7_561859_g1310_i0_p1_ORF_typecomplete_len500_score61_65GSH_synth_ATP/PF03917_17/3_5e99GSH_synthase/PF03199_15/1_5e12_NODE_1604_length_1696_cov_7_561859_g1310_i01951511
MVTKPEWLLESYANVEQVDDFIKHFTDITRRVYIEGGKDIQKCLRAYVARSDYLCYVTHTGELRLGQVEINLSSVVGPDVMENLVEFHKDTMSHYRPMDTAFPLTGQPENRPRTKLSEFLAVIPSVYTRKFPERAGDTVVILFVSGDQESNWPEIQAEIREVRKHGHLVYQTTFAKLVAMFDGNTSATREIDGTQRLVLAGVGGREGWVEVCCVYWRTAYTPVQYPTAEYWRVRELLEGSEAVVIPSAISQLAGLKKVQQLWCQEDHLARLVPSEWKRHLLQSCFVAQVDPSAYAVDPKTQAMVDEALQHPERFVLKPQREGGANNYYNEEIPPRLVKEMHRPISSYILMHKIPAAVQRTAVVERVGRRIWNQESISELGVYAATLMDGPDCVKSDALGYLLRTKGRHCEEGGVSIGAAVFDSVYLVSDKEYLSGLVV